MKNNLRKFWAIALLVIFGGVLLYLLRDYMTAIFAAVVLVIISYPMYEFFLKKTNDREVLSASLTIISLLLLVIIPLSFLVALLIQQISKFSYDIIHG